MLLFCFDYFEFNEDSVFGERSAEMLGIEQIYGL